MSKITKKFDNLIPNGYQILYGVSTAGAFAKKDNVTIFLNGSSQSVVIKQEPNNEYDKKAIAVYGTVQVTSMFIFKSIKTVHLGYLPKEIASDMYKGDWFEKIVIRPKYVSVNGKFVDVEFDILAKKELVKIAKKALKKEAEEAPANKEQKDQLKFFDVKLPKGLNFKDAGSMINQLSSEKEEIWNSIVSLYDDVTDTENMKENDIKKISFKLFLEIMKENKSKILDMEDFDVFELALEKKPDLERK